MGNIFKTIWEGIADFANFNKDVVVSDLDKKAGNKVSSPKKASEKKSEKRNSDPYSSKKETKTLFRKRVNAVQRLEPIKLDKKRKKPKKAKSKTGK